VQAISLNRRHGGAGAGGWGKRGSKRCLAGGDSKRGVGAHPSPRGGGVPGDGMGVNHGGGGEAMARIGGLGGQ